MSDFPATTIGAVSLIQRGTCAFVQKLQNAVEVEKLYPNVVAETPRGDPNHMVLLGAHLDSVPAGPGVNDDGSGMSFQLELAEQLAKAGSPPRNKIRFLWFGGEEDGLVGSQYYAAHLSDTVVARTDMMLDTDMIASPNFARLVYDGDGSTFGSELAGPGGSGTIERVLTDYWSQRGMVSEPIPFDGRSDYVGFINRGIPAGGMHAAWYFARVKDAFPSEATAVNAKEGRAQLPVQIPGPRARPRPLSGSIDRCPGARAGAAARRGLR